VTISHNRPTSCFNQKWSACVPQIT
jgi:hypothetical protein